MKKPLFEENESEIQIRSINESLSKTFLDVKPSGSHFIKGGELVSLIEIELNVNHPKYSSLYRKISSLVLEAQQNEKSLVLSSVGL